MDRPPVGLMLTRKRYEKSGHHTFKDNQNQANVAQGEKCLLPVRGQDVAQRHAVDEAHDDVANQ